MTFKTPTRPITPTQPMSDFEFNSVEEAIEAIKRGEMIIIVDDENRENEGDLVIAGEKCTPDAINFMATYGRGLICIPIKESRAKELDLELMTKSKDKFQTAFTVSVDAAKNTTTGISAYDRCETVKVIVNENSTAMDLKKPGHIFPLIAKTGGVLRRAGHTEASIDLAKLAGLKPVGVICEIMNENGTMARLPDLIKFKKQHNLIIITIKDLIKYRMKSDSLIEKVSEAFLPTEFGKFTIIGYRDITNDDNYIALTTEELNLNQPILVRVHSACLTSEVLGSLRCDCKQQLQESLKMIAKEGGVLLYIPAHEGRGIGLLNKIATYALQDQGKDTVEANEKLGFEMDQREYGIGAQVLAHIGLKKIKLLTNNPRKMVGLEGYSLEIVERLPIKAQGNEHNKRYLETKKEKLGHLI